MKKDMMLNSLLAAVVGAALLGIVTWKALRPWAVIPVLNIPVMAGLMIVALVLEQLIFGVRERSWLVQTLLAVVTFGLLPCAAGVVSLAEAWKYAACGGAVFFGLGTAFTSMVKRMEATCDHKWAVVPTGFVLFLACQCFAGMII